MKRIRKEIRQKSALRVFHPFNIRDEAKGASISNTSYHCIQTNSGKFFHKRFSSNPVITQEHHCLFAALMGNIHHLFGKPCNFSALKCLEILEFLTWYTILIIVVTLVNDIFGPEHIASLLFKLF